MMHKTETVHVRMTSVQYEVLCQEARAEGMNLSEYLRHIIKFYQKVQGQLAVTEG